MKNKIQELQLKDKVTRSEIQSLCLELQSEQFILLNFCTRLGKTKAALNCIKAMDKTLVVTPTLFINDNWNKELENYNLDCKVICYQSLHKELSEYDCVVLDEFQHVSPRVQEILNAHLLNNPNLRVICLTGTLPYQQKLYWKRLSKGKGFEWKIDLDTAIRWGIIPAPTIICVGLSLRNDKRVHLYHKGRDKNKQNLVVQYKSKEFWDNIRRKDINLQIQVTESEWFEMINNDIDYWKKLSEDKTNKVPYQIISNMINKLGSDRKKMFSQLKNRYIRKITNHFKLEDKRVVYFCNDIPQTEFIDSNYAVHSKKKGGLKLVEEFNEGIHSKLVACNQLNEGVNLYNVDAAIIVQASLSEVRSNQQSARPLISEFPLIIILYYKGTRDQEYVEKFVKQFNSEYVKWITP